MFRDLEKRHYFELETFMNFFQEVKVYTMYQSVVVMSNNCATIVDKYADFIFLLGL